MALRHVLIEGERLEITPFDINTNDHFWNAFDHSETEVSARWIVLLCQKRGTWGPFSGEAIEELYRENFESSPASEKVES